MSFAGIASPQRTDGQCGDSYAAKWGPDHSPTPCTKRRCAMCSMMKLQRRSVHQCRKCRAVLCINRGRDCFSAYHLMHGFKPYL
ncbi:hypothetical protein HPB47_022873 [Ixodes persulcatus]|uniref:Uncharacterized protein n=1 Tax=Ixodes persulcatus TaxID=34615 RepID=A0AC60Q8Z9_IXOPE|nr:hypothetical protein HPB47_022873 [Ixodes persulcatus]